MSSAFGSAELLDPRFAPMPGYWPELRARAGLRADWSWPVLAAQGWCARAPQLVSVLHGADRPVGVVFGAQIGPTTRPHRFVRVRQHRRFGLLDVRSPGTSALPGWWFERSDGFGDQVDDAMSAIRARLGPGPHAVLLRQLDDTELPQLGGPKLARDTEPVAVLRTDGFTCREDWIAALRKNRRANLRKIFRTFEEDPDIMLSAGPGTEADPARLAELMRFNAVKHADAPILPLPLYGSYLSELLAQPDVRLFLYAARDTGTLLGAGIVLDHPQWPVFRSWSALPRELGGPSHLYFAFYGQLINWAIDAGKQGLILGKGMPELKTSLGASLRTQHAAARLLR